MPREARVTMRRVLRFFLPAGAGAAALGLAGLGLDRGGTAARSSSQ